MMTVAMDLFISMVMTTFPASQNEKTDTVYREPKEGNNDCHVKDNFNRGDQPLYTFYSHDKSEYNE